MKKPYIYKRYDRDMDAFDLECLNWQSLDGCLGFDCYFDLCSYVMSLLKDKIIDKEWDEKLKNVKIDRDFIETEIDKIRVGKKSVIDEYVDIIDCENVANIPKRYSNIWYFLY